MFLQINCYIVPIKILKSSTSNILESLKLLKYRNFQHLIHFILNALLLLNFIQKFPADEILKGGKEAAESHFMSCIKEVNMKQLITLR